MYKIITWFLFLLIGCERTTEPSSSLESPIPVKAIMPSIKDVPSEIEVIGHLRSSIFIEIYPQVEGILQAVYVKEGEWVKAGTPLFQIDPQAHLLKMKEIEAQIAIDQAMHAAAEKKLRRYHQLIEKNLVAESEWDRHKMEVAKTSGAIALGLAKLERAHLDLDRCTIRSPIDGWVGKIDASPGALISQGKGNPLGTVLQIDPLVVEFLLTESEFEKLQDQEKTITIQRLCGKGLNCSGNITFIDSHFDTKTGQIFVRGRLANSCLSLKPGQLVNVRIPVSVQKEALLIPEKAVKHNLSGPYVYVISHEKTAQIRSVLLGETIDKEVIIKQGLSPQDQIISEGHLRLHPGMKVEIKS